MPKQPKIPKVCSIADLNERALKDPKYTKLAVISAQNLGGTPRNLQEAINWLHITAVETDEVGVVEEINFCLDLVKS